LLLAVLVSLGQAAGADDGQTQTTISFYAGGKPVGGFIFPVGAPVTPSAVAHRIDQTGAQTRYTGNVQGRITPPVGQIILFGADMVVQQEAIGADRLKAVQDLAAMAGPDQLYRGKPGGQLTPEEWRRQEEIDKANMARLKEIIDAYGWPGLRFAGAASQTAFMVLQHADHDSQRRYLPLLREAVKRGDALGSHLALLEDRVRVADGKPQLYGSQLSGTPLRFEPIEDEARVDERRRSVGLEPLADYARRFGLELAPKDAAR
jgi:hypothetical protein